MPRLGVIGSLVWDVIYGRDPRSRPVEEWGGIGYALSGLDAALPDDWEIVPIIKVGDDLAARATEFVQSLRHAARDTPLIAVPYPNNRVELRYYSDERRSELLSGGVPGWNWSGLKPVLDTARLDALYINFLSGWELDLETAQLVRRHLTVPIYCDLHMLAWAVQPSGLRTLRPIANVREWCACFDFLQVNEDEMSMLAPDALALAATALHEGVRTLVVTLGKRGAVYFAAPDFESLHDLPRRQPLDVATTAPIATSAPTAARVAGGGPASGPIRTALVAADVVLSNAGDPTGCGDVWGATYFSRLLAGDTFRDAIAAAHRAAARNVEHRGATGLANHLRGQISLT